MQRAGGKRPAQEARSEQRGVWLHEGEERRGRGKGGSRIAEPVQDSSP